MKCFCAQLIIHIVVVRNPIYAKVILAFDLLLFKQRWEMRRQYFQIKQDYNVTDANKIIYYLLFFFKEKNTTHITY